MAELPKSLLRPATAPQPYVPDPDPLMEALRRIVRTPAMPFPDPGAHSLSAYYEAVTRAYFEVQRIAKEAIAAHLQHLPLTGREASLYDLVPPSAAEWFADSPGIANHDWRGGWDACRNRCRTLLDEHIAAASSPSTDKEGGGEGGTPGVPGTFEGGGGQGKEGGN